MCVALRDGEARLDPHAAVIEGRPDFHDRDFGVTYATRFPPYVYSTRANACLVHRVVAVQLSWYCVGHGGHTLHRLLRPVAWAVTACNRGIRVGERGGVTCQLPRREAVRCGICHGQGATFGRHVRDKPDKRVARAKLGCVLDGSD